MRAERTPQDEGTPAPPVFAAAWPQRVQEAPGADALIDARDGSAFSASELDDLVRRVGAWLQGQELSAGARVAIAAEPTVEALLLCMAGVWLGFPPVMLAPGTPGARVGALARECGAAAVLLDRADPALPGAWVLDDTLREAWLGCAPMEDPPVPAAEAEAVVLFSSGSTGAARAVRLSQGELAWGASRVGTLVAAPRPWVRGVPALLHTVTGFRLAVMSWAGAGAPVVLLAPQGSPGELLAQCDAAGVELLSTVPALLRAVAAAPARFVRPARLEAVVFGGAPMAPAERVAAAKALGVPVLFTYGCTETAGSVSGAWAWPDGRVEPGLGRPLVPVRVQGAGGGGLGPGAIGALELAPESPPLGQLDGGGVHEDAGRRWVQPGDLGWLEGDGTLHVVGRAARMHTCPSGEKVLLDDLDHRLSALVGEEVVSVSVTPPGRGAVLVAGVGRELLPAVWLAESRRRVAEGLPARARPAEWLALGELPRLGNSKLDYPELERRVQERLCR